VAQPFGRLDVSRMPNLAYYHPQIVHFVVVLLIVGVLMRLVSLTGRLRFSDHAALAALIFGTIAAVLGVRSGTDAHGPVERIPGTRDLVVHHEELAEKTRNIFFGVVALEIVAIGLGQNANTKRYVRWTHAASAVVGLYGATVLYETAEHGGELVYSYAGGPGLRTNNPKDVERLLIAGLYNQSRADRRAGRLAESATLVDELAKRVPGDASVQLLRVESLLLDQKDYPHALAAADSVVVAPNDARLRPRQATLKADIYLAMGKPDSARIALDQAIAAFPQNARLKAKRDSIK
jgi:uncharacterized membrane protein